MSDPGESEYNCEEDSGGPIGAVGILSVLAGQIYQDQSRPRRLIEEEHTTMSWPTHNNGQQECNSTQRSKTVIEEQQNRRAEKSHKVLTGDILKLN